MYEESEAEGISMICPSCGAASGCAVLLIERHPRPTPEPKCTHPGVNLVRRENYTSIKNIKNFNKCTPVHCSLTKRFNNVRISILKLLYIFNAIQMKNPSKILFSFLFLCYSSSFSYVLYVSLSDKMILYFF